MITLSRDDDNRSEADIVTYANICIIWIANFGDTVLEAGDNLPKVAHLERVSRPQNGLFIR